MVIDRLENIEKYTLLHPLFEQAIDFLKSHDLHSLEIGKTELKGKDLLVNVAQTNPKEKENAKLETHKDYIDIPFTSSSFFCGILQSYRFFDNNTGNYPCGKFLYGSCCFGQHHA